MFSHYLYIKDRPPWGLIQQGPGGRRFNSGSFWSGPFTCLGLGFPIFQNELHCTKRWTRWGPNSLSATTFCNSSSILRLQINPNPADYAQANLCRDRQRKRDGHSSPELNWGPNTAFWWWADKHIVLQRVRSGPTCRDARQQKDCLHPAGILGQRERFILSLRELISFIPIFFLSQYVYIQVSPEPSVKTLRLYVHPSRLEWS